ncbi:MAG: cytochrome c oxidase subunit 3 [Anaerolineae bacterium]|nr:cytochrome c oxidase subunit 3 [Anaerolineae bacterium]
MAQFAQPVTLDDQEYLRQLALKNARLGLLLWRLVNGMVFAFFVFANGMMRTTQPSWPPPGVQPLDAGLPLILTVVIGASFFTASRSLAAIRAGNSGAMSAQTVITGVLGMAFLVGIVAYTAQIPVTGPYSSINVTMNAFHALHVLAGLLLLAFVLFRARQGLYTRERYWMVEAAVVFWQFVVLMWVFFFAVIYVL